MKASDDQRSLVPYRIAICGIPELPGYARAGVTHVLSILDPHWPDPEVFADFSPHVRHVSRFHDVIDFEDTDSQGQPSREAVAELLDFGTRLREEDPDFLLIHCHAGISRSTATAAVLMAQFNPGRELAAFEALEALRPRCWPNSLIVRFADELLGRDGALVEAMRTHHRAIARAHPDVAQMISDHGRAHEVPALRDWARED